MRCANGRLSVENCPVGQVFSVTRSFCHNENEVDPKDRSSYNRGHTHYTGPRTATTHTGIFLYLKIIFEALIQKKKKKLPFQVHQSDSYNPVNNIPATPFSQPGSYQSVSIPSTSMLPPPRPVISPPPAVLAPPLPTKPLAQTQTFNEIACPEAATGRYPHPYDCTKFLMCTNGETHIQDCGPGTAWNRAMEVCDFISNVKECSSNNLASGSSTTTTAITSQSKNEFLFSLIVLFNSNEFFKLLITVLRVSKDSISTHTIGISTWFVIIVKQL